MNINNLIPILLEQRRGIVATCGRASTTIRVKRPSWSDVYNGYPKVGNDDEPATSIFPKILGDDYNKKTFGNACATRVSLGLLKGKMIVRKDFQIQKGDFKDKGFIASAGSLKKWLEKESVWGTADITVTGPSDIKTVANKINESRIKNGVYIILGGFVDGITGHATLWIGNNRDVIGGHNYVSYGGTVYFWELK
ncbi:T6SS effector amidase Tae4 family protein [Chryseobacterium sp. JK1]|uniref:T6SS effector amidase Tae4 family protein n=1 Tax=Chryseobacterium sp. JK1 TaxID=874294 RepID=UPI003D69235F